MSTQTKELSSDPVFKKVGMADRSKLGLYLIAPAVLSCTFYPVREDGCSGIKDEINSNNGEIP